MTIWFASGNRHKKTELESLLAFHTLKMPEDAGIFDFDPEENGKNFLENALIKAQALYRLVKAPVIADDSGLCVDALGGRPGVYSARYGNEGGKKLSDRERNALLLQELADKPRRNAHFVCAIALVLGEDRIYTVQETLEGIMLREERGNRGFGYDPVFLVPELGCTVAELSGETKNRISHRGKAGRVMAALLGSLEV